MNVSSRLRRGTGPRRLWTAGEVEVDLPVVVDWVRTEPETGDEMFRVEAHIDLVDGVPAVMRMSFDSLQGLDIVALQRNFRWASPLEVVTGLLPQLVAAGIDPFSVELPLTGFPKAATQPVGGRRLLTDEFLTAIAREYLIHGRGYTRKLAEQYFVSPRTVVSWIEKARARGILSPPPSSGSVGGHLTTSPQD